MGNQARRKCNNGCNVLKDTRTTQKYQLANCRKIRHSQTYYELFCREGRGGRDEKNIQQNPVNPVLNEKAVLNSSAPLLRYSSRTIQLIHLKCTFQ